MKPTRLATKTNLRNYYFCKRPSAPLLAIVAHKFMQTERRYVYETAVGFIMELGFTPITREDLWQYPKLTTYRWRKLPKLRSGKKVTAFIQGDYDTVCRRYS